ncbi:MAG: amidophosphoribosyltransferase [Candidatus Altiarchaeota archaeon]|nr:amidophosphoribosyltransferase [Candidatus Altiarchaeota archaeon]
MGEKCAVFGIRSTCEVFDSIYYGLYALQHRGQESAGIATYADGKINLHKDLGLVTEVFRNVLLEGKSGVGHVRYSTCGGLGVENSQPLLIKYSEGSFAIAHNGNLVNTKELRTILERRGSVFTTSSDTEIIAQLIVKEQLKTGDFIEGIKSAMNHLKGAYSLVILKEDKVIAARDPWGFRPLVLGKSDKAYAVASETCALDCLEMEVIRDVKPSEIIVIGDTIESFYGKKEQSAHCMFEYVYFARHDSLVNDRYVYEVRRNLGRILAKEAPAEADLVVAVPDSGITAAIGFSQGSGISYGEGLMKNRYYGRTFIMPRQKDRENGVKIKLNPIKSEIRGKRIVLVDDSIVRGTTVKRIIKMLRDFGAKEIHVRISCPPIRYPCYYGIDMQTYEEFIAQKKKIDDIGKEINADSLAYISLDGLIDAIGLAREKLCLACLTGDYPIKEEQTRLEF